MPAGSTEPSSSRCSCSLPPTIHPRHHSRPTSPVPATRHPEFPPHPHSPRDHHHLRNHVSRRCLLLRSRQLHHRCVRSQSPVLTDHPHCQQLPRPPPPPPHHRQGLGQDPHSPAKGELQHREQQNHRPRRCRRRGRRTRALRFCGLRGRRCQPRRRR